MAQPLHPDASVIHAAGRGYRPIADYAIIGDAHTAALVATDGSIDWLCWPHFDSPAVFCRLLDQRQGGWFRIGPRAQHTSRRAYLPDTNVLVTTFATTTGTVRLTDCMPVEPHDARRGEDIRSTDEIIRLVEGVEGSVDVEISFHPTFDFAGSRTTVTQAPGGAIGVCGTRVVTVASPVPLDPNGGALSGIVRVEAGERVWVTLAFADTQGGSPSTVLGHPEPDAALQRTIDFWEAWSTTGTYRGRYETLVRRSALVLKLLTFEPTGAIVAAPTTSLPEEIGGVRNWDYRFTWLRDTSLILHALISIGHHDEALDFFEWVESLDLAAAARVQIMYGLRGETDTPERTLDHLEGYRGARPVRIGNAASAQTQLDIFGEVLDAAYYCFRTMKSPSGHTWPVLQVLADRAARRWRERDQGIWEMRAEPQHFLHSKLLCWVAMDRAIRLAEDTSMPGDVRQWRTVREEIRQAILTRGYNSGVGAFTQAFDSPALDASALLIPLVGFLPASDPRVQSTVRRIQQQLTSDGLVYRYRADDGLPGGEATFAICSFWMVDNLALAGRLRAARELFEKVTSYANDVGLLAEEIRPSTGELLGNFPQGFTHLALIRSAVMITEAEQRAAGEMR